MGQLGWVWFGGMRERIYIFPSSSTAGEGATGNIIGSLNILTGNVEINDYGLDSTAAYGWIDTAIVDKRIYILTRGGRQSDSFAILDTVTGILTLTKFGFSTVPFYNWSHIVAAGSKLYCIPVSTFLNDDRTFVIGIIDSVTDTLTTKTFTLPPITNPNSLYQFRTVSLIGTKIYCIPLRSSADNLFAIFDTADETISTSSFNLQPEIDHVWFNSIVFNTKIYCIPSTNQSGGNAFGILNTETNTISITSFGLSSGVNYRWFASAKVDTKIYLVPSQKSANNDDNLFGLLDTTTNTLTTTTFGADSSADYSWTDAVSVDSTIYCIPRFNLAGNLFGVLDTTTNTLTTTTFGADPSVNYSWISAQFV